MIPLCGSLALLPAPNDAAPTCLVVDLDLAGRLEQSWPDDGVSAAFTLPRSRLELGVTSERYRARVAMTAARTGGLGSSTGVSGESIVPVLQLADAAWLGPNITVAAGLIDDPWIALGNDDWGLRAAGAVLGEAVGWMDRSDLGASVAWGAPDGFISLIATLTTGEGARYAERNNGKDTTVMAIARPIPEKPDLIQVSLLARDGSRGLDSARDHRAGDGDIDRTPVGVSVWTEGSLPLSLSAFARYDQTDEDTSQSTTRTLRGGLTWGAPPARVILGLEHSVAGEQAMPVAGADAFSRLTAAYILLSVRQGGGVVLQP
jgi:hypothetical protein